MVGIIDYGMGNLMSVYHAVLAVGAEVTVCRKPAELRAVTRLILPGVGAFRDCMQNLRQTGFVEALNEAALQRRLPVLGICLGMQAMAKRSFEGGEHEGLGWFDADVVRIQPSDPALRVPHMGWNQLQYRQDAPLFAGLPPVAEFYFVHSYHLQARDPSLVLATCDHGGTVTAAVGRDNIFATQFHPEKSQEHGLRVLQNFVAWKP